MKKFCIVYILFFTLISLDSNSQSTHFTVNDSILISSLSVRFVADSSASTNYSFLWDFGDGTTSTDSIVNHTYASAGSYFVQLTATPASGPVDAPWDTTITIVDVLLNVPNVFSPNDDGINDFFIVQSDGNRFISIQIFTRSGALVYKNTAPVIAWNGRNLSGTKVTPGVYYYIITTSDGSIPERTGFLQLFK